MKLQDPTRSLFALFTAVTLLVLGIEAITLEPKHALLHGSVSMSSPPQVMRVINFISWKFDKNGKRITILESGVKPYIEHPSQFRDRLQVSDDLLTLTIMNLTMEDSGAYTNIVADINGRLNAYLFNVTVYEPVPRPTVTSTVKEDAADRCNVMLHCSVPSNTSDFSYTWELSTFAFINELNINENSMQMSLRKDSTDIEILCVVHNPADQKNVSIQLQDICKAAGGRSLHLLIIKPVQCVLFLVPLIIYLTIIVKGPQVSSENTDVSYEETIC